MFARCLVLTLGFACVGCGGAEAPSVPSNGPLTVEEWKRMDDMIMKYDPATFDRLKKGDPKLEKDAAWDNFMKTVVVPERKVDIPPRKYNN
jgi:hypothetical protein